MSETASNIQAVFLIDVSVFRNGGTKLDEAITLAVFRVLCFLNSQLQTVDKNKTKSLRWGYKFFDIDEKVVKIDARASSFQDFKLKTFQEFERSLKRCLLMVVRDADETHELKNEHQEEMKNKKGFLLPTHPSLCLSKRLTETMHDFPWEMPDVGSPVKGKKILGQFEAAAQFNYVFLISRIPCDKKSLRHYCNKVVMDKNVFIDALMPPLLRKQFCDEHKIQLHWIDTGRYQILNETSDIVAADKKSYEMVRHSLRMVGGQLIPFHSLVTLLATPGGVQPRSDCDTAGGAASEGVITRRDHVTILLSSFACMSVCNALVMCSARKKNVSEWGSESVMTSATLTFGKSGAGEAGNRTVHLKLVPITRKVKKRVQNSAHPLQLELRTSDDLDGTCLLVRQPTRALHLSHASSSAADLQARACMDKWHVRKLAGNLGRHCVCLVAESAPRDQHKAFSSLLRALQSRQQALILSVTVDKENCPYLAVLEASSASSAHLTYLSLGMTLQMEKQLTLQDSEQVEKAGESYQGVPSAEFRDKAVRTIAWQKGSTDQEAGGADHALLSGKLQTYTHVWGAGEGKAEPSCETSEGCRLWTSVLNPWHMAGSLRHVHTALDSLTKRLPQKKHVSKTEKHVLRELKQVYHRESQPFFLHPSQQSTPLYSTSSSSFPLPRTDSADRSNSSLNVSEGRKSGKHESILTRGRLMVMRAKSLSNSSLAQDEVDGEYVPQVKPEMLSKPEVVPQPEITQDDVKSEDDLSQFVQQEYRRALETEASLEPVVQTVVAVTLQFMTKQDSSCPQRRTARFLEERILKTHEEVRSALPRRPQEGENKESLKELKLQAFIRLEIESMCSGVDQIDQAERQESCDQIVELLKALLFSLGPKPTLEFLSTCVLHSYRSTLPDLLVTIYDELMQPLPPELGGSPERTPNERSLSLASLSALAMEEISRSIASSDQSNTSPKRRTRSSAHGNPVLPSIGNKRQIVVKAPPAKKGKGSLGKKGSKGKSKKEKVKSPAKQRGGKKTRRNLFNTELCKEPSKKEDAEHKASRASRKKHPSASSSKSNTSQQTFVAETPHHRQRGRMSLRLRQEEEKQPSFPEASDVKVIQESPFKDVAAESHKSTPGRYKAPRRVLRRSFYSSGTGHSSRSLSRALENPSNISGRHHVAHLEGSKAGQLAQAIGKKEGTVSPRRQIAALLNPRSSNGTSPNRQSPAHNTRSRTPQRSSRRHLYEDTRSMPAFPSVAKILDFTSPKKPSATALQQIPATPPRTGRSRRTLLMEDTDSQPKDDVSHLTHTKDKGSTSHMHTPTKSSSTSKYVQGSPSDKRKTAASSTPTKGISTPKKRGRGQDGGRCSKGVSPQGNSSSSSQQSSILNYVSPTRRPSTNQDAQSASYPGLSSPTGQVSVSRSQESGGTDATETVQLHPRPRPSYATTPTKTKQLLLSPVRTPTKSKSSPARSQQFLSPTKTPTKSILRNSPMLRSSPAKRDMSTTPQKSPRVTFSAQEVTSPSESELKMQDSLSKWQRRKRRRSGDQDKSSSPTAGEERVISTQSGGKHADLEPSDSSGGHGSGVVQLIDSRLKESSQGFVAAIPVQGVTSRKRSSLLSETDNLSSSPRKRLKMDSSAVSGISRPTLFSENAVDSYFSASSDDVFLSGSSTQLLPLPSHVTEHSAKASVSSRPLSPLFKGKKQGKETAGRADSGRAFDFAATNQSSFDSVGGSQGFEVVASGGTGEEPSSPTFSTSPVLMHRGTKRNRDQAGLGGTSGGDVRTDTQDKLLSTVDRQRLKETSSPGKADPPCSATGAATPTGSAEKLCSAVKGLAAEQNYSQNVSSTSLAQLINSPLLLGSTDKQLAQEAAAKEESAHSPTKKKSRKKLQM